FALAALLLWPPARRHRLVSVAEGDRRALFLLGFVGVTLYFGFENFGLKYTTATHGALIVATIPLTTEATNAFLQRRLPRPLVLAGLLTALFGVILLVGPSPGGATLVGDILMLAAVTTWVWYTFLAERLVKRYPNLLLTFRIMSVGALTLLPGALLETLLLPLPRPSLTAWIGVLFLGVVCSALAYHLWNQAIPVLGVAVTNNLLYGIPLVGVLTGVVALGEPLTKTILIGGALIIGGVLLASRNQINNEDRQSPRDN
ncbi:DMT family transporter, partial [Trichloromonas sp.]|uniref:DMT family transporter n=1 Tax=Trichloromonas sp. TaxID=3069249 RepID=UPI003D81665C